MPIDVLLKRDQRTVYSGEVYYSTDFGGGVRVGAERRWLNKKGHKADAQIEYSQRLQEAALHYQIRGRVAKTVPTTSAPRTATKPRT